MVQDMNFDDEVEQVAQTTRRRNTSRDVKDIINAIMDSPVSLKYGDTMVAVDGKRPLDKFKNQTLDAKTMLLLNITNNALKTGDVKIAEFLMKYGGYEPPKQQQISVELPQIINDIPTPVEDTRNVHAKKVPALESKEMEDAIVSIITEESDESD